MPLIPYILKEYLVSMLIREYLDKDKAKIINLGNTLHDNYLLNDIKSPNKLLVIEKQESIIGFIHFMIFADYIDTVDIVVDKNYRNQGLGTKLLKSLDQFNVKEIVLEVKETNEIAINFYLKNGFAKVGIRKGYYNGVDGITMKKVI